jgi:hypothetical protein
MEQKRQRGLLVLILAAWQPAQPHSAAHRSPCFGLRGSGRTCRLPVRPRAQPRPPCTQG